MKTSLLALACLLSIGQALSKEQPEILTSEQVDSDIIIEKNADDKPELKFVKNSRSPAIIIEEGRSLSSQE